MHRTWMLLLVLAACKGKGESKQEPKQEPLPAGGSSGSGSAVVSAAKPIEPPSGAAPKLAWKDPEGELLIATDDGKTLTGPCGMTGTLTATEVAMGTQKPEAWNRVMRDGKKYSFPKLDWVIEVADTGDVVLNQHGTKKPLGTVTGLDSDEAAAWFGAFVAAAPMVQHQLEWTGHDGAKWTVGGSADFRSWTITAGGAKLSSRERADPAPLLLGDTPAWDPKSIDVTIDGGGKYRVTIKRDNDATKAAFAADTYNVSEADDGTLTITDKKPLVIGKLAGRAKCRAHDQAVPALLWTLFASKPGHVTVFGT